MLILSVGMEAWKPVIGLADVLLIFPALFKAVFAGAERFAAITCSVVLLLCGAALLAGGFLGLRKAKKRWQANLPNLLADLRQSQECGTLTDEQAEMLEELTGLPPQR